ncbi:hypothetical protein MLD38_003275 [Melastoma candidum]|uniref:Uncharacterized protein n=1 Tax=Melastoma candidum TaxID=119954 RepID=A0ACB9SAK9_9MYRT|nr:hypothetical protein MLD38_003275 [Melastoma candidum]
MYSSSTQFVPPRVMGIYESIHQMGMWEDDFKPSVNPLVPPPLIVEAYQNHLDNQSEDTSNGSLGTPRKYEQVKGKSPEKVQRRLAQNREAARKSRLRKKAYVQQLEASHTKLMQMELEVDRARRQGTYIAGGVDVSAGFSGPMKPEIVEFEAEYGHWVQEQNRQTGELRTALQANTSDITLQILVQNGMKHYSKLFRMKAEAAQSDVFYMMSGMWRTPAERFFLWIGGFRPSEIIRVLMDQLRPLSDMENLDVHNMKITCQQAEDALSQGLEKLQQALAENVAKGHLGEEEISIPETSTAIQKIEEMISFVNQADHIRHETLWQMSRVLTIHGVARGLIALGEYFERLRALSQLWASRRQDPS